MAQEKECEEGEESKFKQMSKLSKRYSKMSLALSNYKDLSQVGNTTDVQKSVKEIIDDWKEWKENDR